MEGDRFQPENGFARLVHRFDRVLETRRGGCRAKLTGGVYLNGCACNRRPVDPRNKGSCLCSGLADANRTGFAGNASVANIDIVTTRGEIFTCGNTQRDVAATARVINERVNPVGSVMVTGCVVAERTIASARVVPAVAANERKIPDGRVAAAGCVVIERCNTVGRVVVAGRVAAERFNTVGGVAAAGTVSKQCTSTVGRVRLSGCVITECSLTSGSVTAAFGVEKQRSITGTRVP